jgi:hypothetical protein
MKMKSEGKTSLEISRMMKQNHRTVDYRIRRLKEMKPLLVHDVISRGTHEGAVL